MSNQEKTSRELEEKQIFEEEEISLREIIEVILRHKWFIVGLIVAAVLAAGFFTLIQREGYATAVLEFNFEEIQEGHYPSGAPFASSDIVSPYVLSRVVDQLKLKEHDLGVGDLQGMIEVEELFYQVGNDDDPDYEPAYQYRLAISQHGEVKVPSQLKRRVLSSVVQNYREAYSTEFIERSLFPRLADSIEVIEGLDYPFISMNLRSYQEMFRNYAMEMAGETGGFYSAQYGMSFEDLARRLDTVKETQYEDISATIRSHSLTRDREGALRHYNYLIEELELLQEKKSQEADYGRQLLEDARPLRTGKLPDTFPAVIEEDNHDLMQEIFDRLYRENFYPELLQVSVAAADESIDKNYEIEFLRQEVELMEEATATGIDMEDVKVKVEKDIGNLISSLDRLVNTHNGMMEEYYEGKGQKGISYAVMPFYDVESGNLQLNLAVASVLGLMVGVFIAFFREFWKNTNSENQQEK